MSETDDLAQRIVDATDALHAIIDANTATAATMSQHINELEELAEQQQQQIRDLSQPLDTTRLIAAIEGLEKLAAPKVTTTIDGSQAL